MPIYFHMSYLRKKPPADAPNINSGQAWSEVDLADLKQYLLLGDSAKAIAVFLCRDVDEVRAKTTEIVAQGKS
jgi:hypothetical protein